MMVEYGLRCLLGRKFWGIQIPADLLLIEHLTFTDRVLDDGMCSSVYTGSCRNLHPQRAENMRRDHDRVSDPYESIEGKNQADARLLRAAVFDFNLTEVIAAQEKTTTGRSGYVDEVALAHRRHRRQAGILFEQKPHLALDASAEALAAAATRIAFRTNVMKDAVRKAEEKGNRFLSDHHTRAMM